MVLRPWLAAHVCKLDHDYAISGIHDQALATIAITVNRKRVAMTRVSVWTIRAPSHVVEGADPARVTFEHVTAIWLRLADT